MLHAAAMAGGLFVCWLTFTQRWSSPEDFGLAAVVAVVVTGLAARFGAVGRDFAVAPLLGGLAAARAADVARGALRVLRAAAAADVTLKPALVRVKTRGGAQGARAAFVGALSGAPGAIAVDGDADSVLVHVLDEDAIDAAELGRLETRTIQLAGGAQ